MIDPLTAATTFGTIVSLIADFRAQRADRTNTSYEEFEAWLQENRHDEVVTMLRQNFASVVSIKALLSQDRETLRQRLDHLDHMLASLASAVDGFGALAGAVRPESRLSRQAIEFLRQFDRSGGSKVLKVEYLAGPIEFVLLDANGSLPFEDQRFIEDDLMTAVDLGLLRLDYNKKGERIFILTRYAVEFIRSLPGDSA